MTDDHSPADQRSSANPTPSTDLGYKLDEWDVVDTKRGDREFLLFSPSEERRRANDEYIVAAVEDVCDLADHL